MKVVWSPLALQKLGDAAEFILLDNPEAAEKWDALFLKCLIQITVKLFLVTIVLSTV